MKRFLLLLILACGMFASAFAQPETPKKNNAEVSDKWVITPISTMKGVLGSLDINFPADVERTILIYQQSDKKFLTSISRNDKTYTIAPGEYRFVLTTVPIENVPIKKGHQTRLRAGFLDIVSEGKWFLYDEAKKKIYTTGAKPKKMILPVGRYQIKLGGQFFPVVIKDGKTVEDYSPLDLKDEINSDQVPNPSTPEPDEAERWVITPFPAMTAEALGKLSIMIPEGQSVVVFNQQLTIPFDNKIRDTVRAKQPNYTYSFINLPKFLPPNPTYNISLNGVQFSVPIRAGKETRIKAGFLIITKKETEAYSPNSVVNDINDAVWGNNDFPGEEWIWTLQINGNNGKPFMGKKGAIFALPPGVYSLTKTRPSDNKRISYSVTIKDGEWVKNGVR